MFILPTALASLVFAFSPAQPFAHPTLEKHSTSFAREKGDLWSRVKQHARGRAIADGANGTEAASSEEPSGGSRLCPANMVMVGTGYCIDMYEGSLVEQLANGEERDWPFYETIPAGVIVRAVSRAGVYPQGYISGVQAKAACEASGKRLCKPDEWKKACMGPAATIFPYGNKRETGRCNDNGRSPMQFYFHLDDKPEHAWKWGFNGNMIDPRLNQLEGTLAKTGEHPECTNEYGAYDMMGNLHEWVDDPDGTFQGGYYLDTHLNGDGCYYRTTAHPMSHLDYSTGFRCCADATEE
jgi:Sulfatase-modifying factor enzyme 1